MAVRISRWRQTPFPAETLHNLCERAFATRGIEKPSGWRRADWQMIEQRSLPGQEVLVAHAQGQVIGVAVTAVSDAVCDLMLIATDPDLARAGVGRALIDASGRLARPRGARRMMLEVSDRNIGAQTFYEALGFTLTARRKGYFGKDHDALVMSLPIDDKL